MTSPPLMRRIVTNLADTRARWRNRRFVILAPPLGRDWMIYLVVALAAVALAAYFLDSASVAWAQHLPQWIREIGFATTDYGQSGWELYPAGIVILVLLAGEWGRVSKRVKLAWAEFGALATFLFVAVAGAGIAVNIIKNFIGRARPPLFETAGPFAFKPFVFEYLYQSFPSGHSTTCGAVALVGAIVFPRWRWLIVVAAVLLASTRVVVAAHYPSDVVAGFLLGAVIAYLLARYFASSGYGLAFSGDQVVARTGAIRRLLRGPGGWSAAWKGLGCALRLT